MPEWLNWTAFQIILLTMRATSFLLSDFLLTVINIMVIWIKSAHFGSLSVQFSRSVVSIIVQFNSIIQSCPTLWPHGLQHAMLPCPSPSHGACLNSCPSSRWCPPTISSSVVPFSSCLQSFPVSGSFPMSQLLASSGQSIGASASVLPMKFKTDFL